MSSADSQIFRQALESEASTYDVSLSQDALSGLTRYYDLLQTWNGRLHLVAPCSPQQFATRHVLESLLLLKHLTPNARIVEVGAGAGLPMLPCLIVRSDLEAVLIEASKKKSVFLREALAHTGNSSRGEVINRRFEEVEVPEVGFVTCRALERFDEMLTHLLKWAPSPSTLLLLGAKRLTARIENQGYQASAELMPGSKGRFLFVVRKD